MNNNHENIVISFHKGDEIISSLLEFCNSHKIKSAWVNGIGAVQSAELSFYNAESKNFTNRTFAGDYELTCLSGNIALLDGKTVAHLHAAISGQNFETFGGHLQKAVVSVTCEICIFEIKNIVTRKHNEEFNLNLIDQNPARD